MNETSPEPAPPAKKKRFSFPIPREWEMFVWGVVIGVVALTLVQTFTGRDLTISILGVQPAAQVGGNAPAPTYAPVDLSKLTIREANAMGAADAPVTIFEFSDFQCPFCRRSFETVIPTLLQDYVSQGKVRFVYKHFPFLGQESTWAAEASECAADQGKFWEYHDELFKQAALAGGENAGAFTKDNLIKYAAGLQLDMQRFTPCLEHDDTLARVNTDLHEGQAQQVSSTPTFFVNTTRLVGAQPLQAFVDAIRSFAP